MGYTGSVRFANPVQTGSNRFDSMQSGSCPNNPQINLEIDIRGWTLKYARALETCENNKETYFRIKQKHDYEVKRRVWT